MFTVRVAEVMETAKVVARDRIAPAVNAVLSPIAETVSFLSDCVAWLLKDSDAWRRKPYEYRKELIHETNIEYPVVVDGRKTICRKTTRWYAIRGKNRRAVKYDFTYRVPTNSDKRNKHFQEIWNRGG